MTINRSAFFAAVRSSFGALKQSQVDGFNKILDEWERRGGGDGRHLAYRLATVWHETDKTMQPVREKGGEAYLRKKKYYPWVGEGLVQVTWEENHRKFGATKPGQLMTWPIALKALFDGMDKGMFTGRKLSDYFSATKDDPRQARKIINGMDKADLIAGHHAKFLTALNVREVVIPPPPDVEPIEAPKVNWLVSLLQAIFRRKAS